MSPNVKKRNVAPKLKKMTLRQLRELTKDKSGENQERTFAAALDLERLGTYEAALLTVVQRIHREQRGCSTPVDDFVDKLLRSMMHVALTPEQIRADVDELQENWNLEVAAFRKFYQEHPNLLTEQPVEQEEPSNASQC